MGRKLTYWQKRFIQINAATEKMTDEYLAGMADRYEELGKSIEYEIDKFVTRYSDESGLSEKEIDKMLSKGEQTSWSMTLKEFRQKAIDGGYDKELNIEYYKSRISRLQKLKAQLAMEFAEFTNAEEGRLKSFLSDQYRESYLRNIYELTDRGAFVVPFDKYNSRALRLALSTPWKSSNFKKRIWKAHLKVLPERLSRTLSYSVTHGWGIDRTVKEMMRGFKGVARNRVVTLVQTESAHIIETATLESYRQLGVEKYEWLATLESHTCREDITINGFTYKGCAGLDGLTFDVDSENPILPPVHPNCRCTTVPVIKGYRSSKRWMRDPETGKGEIIDNISFTEWSKKYMESA